MTRLKDLVLATLTRDDLKAYIEEPPAATHTPPPVAT